MNVLGAYWGHEADRIVETLTYGDPEPRSCRQGAGDAQDMTCVFFFFQAEDGIRDLTVTGVQTCALPISDHGGEAGGEPAAGGIVPDDPDALEAALRAAVAGSDIVVVSAGSSVGARDGTEIGRAACRGRG